MQFLQTSEAKCHPNTGDAVFPSSFCVVHTIAYKDRRIPVINLQHIQRLLDDLRLCADCTIQRRAGNRIKKSVNLKQMQDSLDKDRRLGRSNRYLLPRVAQRLQ